jgi:hypothetical protein
LPRPVRMRQRIRTFASFPFLPSFLFTLAVF